MERLRDIVTELVERSAAVVRRYGGTVEFTGDGVMAIFGAGQMPYPAATCFLPSEVLHLATHPRYLEIVVSGVVPPRMRFWRGEVGDVGVGDVGVGDVGVGDVMAVAATVERQ